MKLCRRALERVAALIWLCLISSGHSAPELLDIYFEENHAGTFYHLAETLPLDTPHRLILIDAHSDASAVADSDKIRDAIRNVPSAKARTDLLAAWRKRGTIQCFDWLEPLMPLPFDEVWWIPAHRMSPLELGRQQTLARESLDGLLEAFPRRDGEIGGRYRALGWEQADALFRSGGGEKSTIVSIDLDYFAATPDPELEAAFREVFQRVCAVPGLKAITFSLSLPWLRDTAQAERLTVLALESATSVANARVHFAPDASAGPDRSRRALELRKKNEPVPSLQLDNAGWELRSLLLARQSRLVRDEALTQRLEVWARDPFLPKIAIANEVADPDGWVRLAAKTPRVLRANHSGGQTTRWYALVPDHPSVNVAGIRLGFAEDAPRLLQRSAKLLGEGSALSTETLKPFLEPATGAGTAIVFATTLVDGETRRSPELRLAFRAGAGFRAALSEGFARPYAFGCGLVPGGPDALVATDCANFVIAALRREGWRIPWGDPKQFATQCAELGQWERNLPPLRISREQVEAGLFVHFGSHVGAVWEDRAPLGTLDPSDLIAHHLEGLPEIVPLERLLAKHARFRLLQLRADPEAARIVFGGDVMLGRNVARTIEAGGNPLHAVAPLLSAADWSMVNLECVASEQGAPSGRKPFHFRAHPKAPTLLAEAGIDAVSVANNHARDFGDAAFRDAMTRLHAAGVRCAEGGSTPILFEVRGQRFALFACEDSARTALLDAITAAAQSAIVIVMPHWGAEHRAEPEEAQRALAGQLVTAGARLIIGSGPHARQPMEFRDGALVAWSLGNLIFDGPGPNAEWSHGALLEVHVRSDGRVNRVVQRPVKIRDDGVCELD